jgi:hypothetical protein
MASSWQRELNTTIHKFIRQEEENILRDRKLLAMMKSRGRITFNNSGDLVDWKVRYKRAPMRVFRESETLTFGRVNRWKTAQLDWRGYAATDSVTKLEKLKNKGAEAIIKVFQQMTENLMADIEENFGDELYVDGNATGNSGRLHGLESFLGNTGGATNGYVATPSDTYAGLLTDLGNYGGNWDTASGASKWPDGKGDPEYDFWTPVIVDYSDTAWAASSKTWASTCEEAIRYGINKMQKNKSRKGMLDMILLEREMYRLLEEKQAAKERIVIKRGDKPGGLAAMGFEDTLNIDGVDVTSEYGVPVDSSGYGYGYGIPMQHIELASLQDVLFKAELPDFDIASYSDRYVIDFFGNLRMNPRYFLAFKKVT